MGFGEIECGGGLEQKDGRDWDGGGILMGLIGAWAGEGFLFWRLFFNYLFDNLIWEKI